MIKYGSIPEKIMKYGNVPEKIVEYGSVPEYGNVSFDQ